MRGGGNINFARRLLGSVLGEETPSRPTDDGPLAASKAIGSDCAVVWKWWGMIQVCSG